jgi:hypothetical protein
MKKVILLFLSLTVLSCSNYNEDSDELKKQLEASAIRLGQVKSLTNQIGWLSSTTTAILNTLNQFEQSNELLEGEFASFQSQLTSVLTELSSLSSSLQNESTNLEGVSTTLSNLETLVTSIIEAGGNIYSRDITISTKAELDVAKALGNKLSLINANVTIDITSDALNASDVNEVTSLMKIVTGNLVVKTDESISFSKLTNVGGDYFIEGSDVLDNSLKTAKNLYLDYDGGYDFPALTSAMTIAVVDYSAPAASSKTGTKGTTNFSFNALTENNAIMTTTEINWGLSVIITGGIVGELNLSSVVDIALGSGVMPKKITAPVAKTITILFNNVYTSSLTIIAPVADKIALPNVTEVVGNLEITGGSTTVLDASSVTKIEGTATINASSIALDSLATVTNGISTTGDEDLDLSGQLESGQHTNHDSGSSGS